MKIKNYGWSTSAKKRIYKKCHNRCACCRATRQLTIDHIIPTSKGGTDDDNNLQILCFACNQIKGNRIINIKKLREDPRIKIIMGIIE